MSKDAFAPPIARTWRDIPQQVKPRAMSPEGRRRTTMATLRVVGCVAALAGAGWGAWAVAMTLRNSPDGARAAARSVPLQPPELRTDGVLDKAWLARTLALPKGATLLGLDMPKLRSRLVADGQVQSAELIRNFPSQLIVRVTERTPVARLMLQIGSGEPRAFLVSRDGVSFAGKGYDSSMLDGLPWLDGVRPVQQGAGLAPIEGMATVSNLLATAKLEAERLYRTWRVVSLQRLASDGEIDVRTRDGLLIRFGAKEDFLRQLGRLDIILEAAGADPSRSLKEVNLTLGAQVPVSFGAPVVPAPVAPEAPSSAPSKGPPDGAPLHFDIGPPTSPPAATAQAAPAGPAPASAAVILPSFSHFNSPP